MAQPLLVTASGTLAGTVEDGLTVFRGIPYAAPPVGSRRFRPPAPPEPWAAVRDASSYGRVSPQAPSGDLIPGDPVEQSEDCLYLNVWTPALDDKQRPVMVFVHGGGFVSGSSSVSAYHGASLARRGVVLVSINYRLGVLGWLAHPALGAGVIETAGDPPGESSAGCGNWGLHDQLAALRWVRDHASVLGGDPGNVTIFGESAGAMSVAALLAIPEARSLVRRAVMQSGAAVALGMDSATRIAEDVASSLGLDSLSREGLEAQPVEAILAAQRDVMTAYGIMGLPFQPVADGGLLTRHPAAEIASGASAPVDLLIGTNRDEWRFFTFSAVAARQIDEERLLKLVSRHVRGAGLAGVIDPAELVNLYRTERERRGQSVEPADVYTALGTDWVFRVPSMRLAAAQAAHNPATFAYLFDWESPFAGGSLGSCHALELPFVFGTTDNPFVSVFTGGGPEAEALSEAMQDAWVAFATGGQPGGAGPGGAGASDGGGAVAALAGADGSRESGDDWPAYSAEEGRATKRLGSVREVLYSPMEAERAYLDSRLGPYGDAEQAHLLNYVHEPSKPSTGT